MSDTPLADDIINDPRPWYRRYNGVPVEFRRVRPHHAAYRDHSKFIKMRSIGAKGWTTLAVEAALGLITHDKTLRGALLND